VKHILSAWHPIGHIQVGEDMDLEQSLVDQSEKDHALMYRFRELHARAQVGPP
jgi:hypothetical protein